MLGLPVLGMIYASQKNLLPHIWVPVLFSSVLYLAHGYGVNDCFDLHYDTRLRKNVFRKFLFFLYMLLMVNVIFSFWYLGGTAAALVLCGGIIGFLYSGQPLRLKKNTVSSLFLNSLGFSLLFLVGFVSVEKRLTLSSCMATVFFAFIFVPLQIMHYIAHAEEDREEGILTLYSRYGLHVVSHVFYASLMVITLWPFLMFLSAGRLFPVFFSTIFLSASLFLVFKNILHERASGRRQSREARLLCRVLVMIYGFIMAGILYFL